MLGRPAGSPLRDDVLLVTESIARRAALAIDNARAHGALLATGQALQASLLPPSLPDVPGLEVGVVYEAAGEGTAAGGDFYDIFPVENGTWCFVVGDVCGTGAEAAAVTGLARHTIRSLMRAGLPGGADPRAAQRGDPRRGGAGQVPHAGVRAVPPGGRAGSGSAWSTPDIPRCS